MKYLENLALENLSKIITNRDLGGVVLNGRVEAYSTKKAGGDKKTSKILEHKLTESAAGKYPNGKAELSSKTKKLLGDLIQTLNASMVDYDFSELTPDSFAQVGVNDAIYKINSYLAEMTVSNPDFLNDMWKDISEAMDNLTNCEVYKLDENTFIDEVENGMLWSFNYFFCSKELKRVCYFGCFAHSRFRRRSRAGSLSGGGALSLGGPGGPVLSSGGGFFGNMDLDSEDEDDIIDDGDDYGGGADTSGYDDYVDGGAARGGDAGPTDVDGGLLLGLLDSQGSEAGRVERDGSGTARGGDHMDMDSSDEGGDNNDESEDDDGAWP